VTTSLGVTFNADSARRKNLRAASASRRSIEPRSARYWKILNPNVRNGVGAPVAYKLVPGANAFPFFQEGSPQWQRGGFVRSHLWVTRYDPRERYAAGDYPNQQAGGDGLPAYVEQNRSLVGTDLVTWYTFGSNHVVRPEDWPVMPVDMLGFFLKPVGFFNGSPALDVPPPAAHCDHHAG